MKKFTRPSKKTSRKATIKPSELIKKYSLRYPHLYRDLTTEDVIECCKQLRDQAWRVDRLNGLFDDVSEQASSDQGEALTKRIEEE